MFTIIKTNSADTFGIGKRVIIKDFFPDRRTNLEEEDIYQWIVHNNIIDCFGYVRSNNGSTYTIELPSIGTSNFYEDELRADPITF
jgi:hypothetical protein